MKIPIPICHLHNPQRAHALTIQTIITASGFVSFAIIAAIYHIFK